MRRSGILNSPLAGAISTLGHGDLVVVADCGLPRPGGVPVVDLALVRGVPRFVDVLDSLLAELVIDRCTAATEAEATPFAALLTERIADVSYVSHEQLKIMTAQARLFVRTGEATPYANAVIRCGPPF